MTTPTAAGLTPDLFGYVRCARCGTWRPAHAVGHSATDSARYLAWLKDGGTEPVADVVCVDVAWCGRQAGVGRGELAPEAL